MSQIIYKLNPPFYFALTIKKISKHSELFKITDGPLQYAKDKVAKFNIRFKESKISDLSFNINFDKKAPHTDDSYSKSTSSNIGYMFLQDIYHRLNLHKFFNLIASDRKIPLTAISSTDSLFLHISWIPDINT